MSYTVRLTRSAEKEMMKLPQTARRRIDRHLLALEEQPYGPGHKKLAGQFGFRVAVGVYRIIYQVDDKAREVEVTTIRHRREAYR